VRPRSDDGTALVEVVWLGILLLVPLVWIVLSVFEVQRGAFAVTGAARAGARAFSIADDDAAGRAQAAAAIRQAMRDQGADQPFRFAVTCPGFADCHERGAVITVKIWSRVTLPLLPDILGGGAPSFALDSTHTVPIGQFSE
jgi:hypothetical protein